MPVSDTVQSSLKLSALHNLGLEWKESTHVDNTSTMKLQVIGRTGPRHFCLRLIQARLRSLCGSCIVQSHIIVLMVDSHSLDLYNLSTNVY